MTDGNTRPGQAWAIEDTPQDLGLIYRQMGVKGLEGIENVGPRLSLVVESLLQQLTSSPEVSEGEGPMTTVAREVLL